MSVDAGYMLIRVNLQGAQQAAAEAAALSGSIASTGTAATVAGRQAKVSAAGVGILTKGYKALVVAAKAAVLALGVGVVVGIKKSVQAASDLQEAQTKTMQVFDKSGPRMLKWSEKMGERAGLSQTAALDAAGSIGAMLKPMGFATDKAANMSRALSELAGDLASFYDDDPSEMLDRLRAGLAGESEPLRRFGVDLRVAAVEEFALRKGLMKQGEELDSNKFTMLAYQKIMHDTKDAQGDFVRTGDGLANSQRRLSANFENLLAVLGKKLTPIAADVVGFLNDLVRSFMGVGKQGKKVSPVIEKTKSVLGSIVDVVKTVVNFIVKHFDKVIAVFQAVVTGVREGVRGIVAGFNWFIQAIKDMVKWVTTAWNNVKRFTHEFIPLRIALAVIKGIIGQVVNVVRGMIGALKAAVQIISGPVKIAWDLFKTAVRIVVKSVKNFGSAVGNVVGIVVALLRGDLGGAFNNLKDLVGDVVNQIKDVLGEIVRFIGRMPGRIADSAKGMFQGIVNAFKSALNVVIRAWNGLEFRVPEIDPPGPGPKFGGFTVGMPDIPELALGGRIRRAGMSIVGERGPELLHLPRGAVVEPLVSPQGGAPEVDPTDSSYSGDRRPLSVRVPVFLGRRQIAEAVYEEAEDRKARQ